jgi:hypothetical protein
VLRHGALHRLLPTTMVPSFVVRPIASEERGEATRLEGRMALMQDT